MRPRHYRALGTVLVAAALATFVLTTQRGKKTEDSTLVAIPEPDLVRISVVWDEGRDAEYVASDLLSESSEDSELLGEAPESAPAEAESAPPAGASPAESEGTESDGAGAEEPEPTRLVLAREDDPSDPMGSHWVFEEPLAGLRVDPSTASNLVKRLSFLECERRIEGEPDLATYGLDRPALTITIEDAKGRSTTLLVGRKHPSADWERFAMLEGAKEAVVVAASLVTDVTRDPQELRDKRLSTLSTDEVRTVQIGRLRPPVESSDAPDDEAEASSESEAVPEPWEDTTAGMDVPVASDSFAVRFQEPTRADEDPEWLLESTSTLRGDPNGCRMFVSDLTNRRAESFHLDHPTTEDLAACGLDEPSQTYVIAGRRKDPDSRKEAKAETTETISVGDHTPEGHVYVMASWRPEILVLKDTDFDALQKSLDDLRNKQLHDFEKSDLARIRTARAGLEVELIPSEDDSERWVLADGTDTEDFAASALVNMAAVLSASKFVDEAPTDLEQYGLDAPAATLTIIPKRGDPVTITFGGPVPGDPASIYARSSLSQAVVTVDSFRLESIPDALSDIAALPAEEPVESETTESEAAPDVESEVVPSTESTP